MNQQQSPAERLQQINKSLMKRGHRMTSQELHDLNKERELIQKYF